ncbi:MAG: ABC transporter permease [Gammaproteobacteria bacterium]
MLISASSALLAAGIGMLLVIGCGTRAQAEVLPTVVILIMSAIGGSMVPRFFMPEWLQKIGWLTPNTWHWKRTAACSGGVKQWRPCYPCVRDLRALVLLHLVWRTGLVGG